MPLLIRVIVSVLNPIVFLQDLVSGIFLALDEIIKAIIDMTFGISSIFITQKNESK